MRYIKLDEVHSEKVIREICEEFPFLIPKNFPDYDYTFLWVEIPVGWYNLFLQMCGDIKPVLKKYNLIDVFEFEQVKEKWGGLRCYYNFGFNYDDDDCWSKEIDDIVRKYEYVAELVCTQCGDIATHTTHRGWISSYCDKCISNLEYLVENDLTKIEPEFSIGFYEFVVDGVTGEECRFKRTLSFEDEWNRYRNLIGKK
jgi:hypothetical protein